MGIGIHNSLHQHSKNQTLVITNQFTNNVIKIQNSLENHIQVVNNTFANNRT